MKKYTLLYRDASLLPADAPLAFTCDEYFTIVKDTIIQNVYCKIDL